MPSYLSQNYLDSVARQLEGFSRNILKNKKYFLDDDVGSRDITIMSAKDDGFWNDFTELGTTPFRTVALEELVERFAKMRRELAQGDNSQNTARDFVELGREFLLASRRGVKDKVELFLDLDFPVNFQDPRTLSTALHVAAGSGARATFDLLIESGQCDYLLRDRQGRLASDRSALFHGSAEMTEILIAKEIEQAKRQKMGPDFFKPR